MNMNNKNTLTEQYLAQWDLAVALSPGLSYAKTRFFNEYGYDVIFLGADSKITATTPDSAHEWRQSIPNKVRKVIRETTNEQANVKAVGFGFLKKLSGEEDEEKINAR